MWIPLPVQPRGSRPPPSRETAPRPLIRRLRTVCALHHRAASPGHASYCRLCVVCCRSQELRGELFPQVIHGLQGMTTELPRSYQSCAVQLLEDQVNPMHMYSCTQ